MNEKGQSDADRAASSGEDDALAKLTPRQRKALELFLRLLNDKKIVGDQGAKSQPIRDPLASSERHLSALRPN